MKVNVCRDKLIVYTSFHTTISFCHTQENYWKDPKQWKTKGKQINLLFLYLDQRDHEAVFTFLFTFYMF